MPNDAAEPIPWRIKTMNRTLKCRDANPGVLGSDAPAAYIRAVEQSGRIRYHRIRPGRRAARLGAKAQTVTRLAYVLCTVSPDAAAEVLTLPPRQVGRIVKAMLRHARRTPRRRIPFKRRPDSCVLRIRASDSARGQSLTDR
jgi:hypothetical protein